MNTTTIAANTWTRQEAIKLSGLTRGQFEVFEHQDFVTPIKIGGEKRPTVFYTWEQILAIRAYAKLRERCTVKSLRQAIQYLNPENPQDVLRDRRLASFKNAVYWIDDTPEEWYKATLLSGKSQGQLVMTFTLSELIEEIKKDGVGVIVDFEERFKQATQQLTHAA